jgi:CheY-like chemotaxis protein
LIILDLSLPRLDGRDFLDVLKKNTRFRSIPVIVLTGSENFRDMQKSRELGVDDYVVKPKTNQELIELIASFGHWLAGSSSEIPKLS